MNEPLLTIDVQRTGTAVVAHVRGELDFGSSAQLVTALGDDASTGIPLVLTLDDLEFCDSSGLGAMIALYKSTNAHGGRLYIAGAQAQVLAVITMTSLDQLFQVRDSLATVLAEIGAR